MLAITAARTHTTMSVRERADTAALIALRSVTGGIINPDALLPQLGWRGGDGAARVFVTTDLDGAGYLLSYRDIDIDRYGRIVGYLWRTDHITGRPGRATVRNAADAVVTEVRRAGILPTPVYN